MGIFFRDRLGQCGSSLKDTWLKFCFRNTTEATSGRIRWTVVIFCHPFTQILRLYVVVLSPSPLPFECCSHLQWNAAEKQDSCNRGVTSSMKTGDWVEDQQDHISLLQGKLWTPLENPHRGEVLSILQIFLWVTGHMPNVR